MDRSVIISRDRLVSSSWLISHDGDTPSSGETFFYADGLTGGTRFGHFARWDILDGTVVLLDGHEQVSSYLTKVDTSEAVLTLSGICLDSTLPYKTISVKEYRRLDCKRVLQNLPEAGQFRHLQEYLSEKYSDVYNRWDIGSYSYGNPTVLEPELANLRIGRFVSISWGVNIALGAHRISGISSYPFAAMRHFWPAAIHGSSHSTKGDVVIGNDVWIGTNVFIGSGVTIGDGVVIAANASVVKDVPPYAVVAGNSSRIVKLRFSSELITKMLNISWWNWDDEIIAAAMPAITSENIQDFFDFCDTHSLN